MNKETIREPNTNATPEDVQRIKEKNKRRFDEIIANDALWRTIFAEETPRQKAYQKQKEKNYIKTINAKNVWIITSKD
jgi:hypothetical protein